MLRLVLLVILLPLYCFSQYDTLYAQKYPHQLGLALFQSTPVYKIQIKQKQSVDSTGISNLSFQTMANFITGLGVHYKDFSFFLGVGTPGEKEQQVRKGETKTSQFNLAFTRMKLRIEASSRRYKGFYDNNSPNYIPDFNDSSDFYQDPEMTTSSLRFKAFYFLNNKKRFSYAAAYINNVRQLKSAGSVILTSNIYTYRIKSDQSIVPVYVLSYYPGFEKFNQFDATSFSLGAGYTHTFVIWKKVFLNFLGTIGGEVRHLKIKGDKDKFDSWQSTLSAYDFRSSIGFQSNRFFISFQSIIDGNYYSMPDLDISSQYICGVFIVGYRFGLKSKTE